MTSEARTHKWCAWAACEKTAFEVKRRLYTTGKVIQRLFIIDLYIVSDISLWVKQTVNPVNLL